MDLTLNDARDLDRLLQHANTLPKDNRGLGEPIMHLQYVKEVVQDDDKETYFHYVYLTQLAILYKKKNDANWFSQDRDGHIRANAATKEFLKNGGFVELVEKEKAKEKKEQERERREEKAARTTIINNQLQAYALLIFIVASVVGAIGQWSEAHWARESYILQKKAMGIVDPPKPPVKEFYK